MNVGELIEELKKYPLDTPVCVDNMPIRWVDSAPAYWDGRLGQLVLNKNNRIVGFKYTNKGLKVRINPVEVSDLFLDQPDLPVTYELEDHTKPDYEKNTEEARAEAKQILKEIEEKYKDS